MAPPVTTEAGLMHTVPGELRARILSGMRWTLWLAVLAVPFSYGTTILLARVGPEVVGTYGLLMVYRVIVICLFYWGGDAVVIKFIPELSGDKRLSFLASYLLVILLALVPWLAAASLWPSSLTYLFGTREGPLLVFLYLSPVYILFSLASAALKAELEMGWAQLLMRVMTVGSFLIYAALYFFFRSALRVHYTGLVWGVFFALAGASFALGMRRLARLQDWRSQLGSLRFFLPRNFWRYSLALQEISALTAIAGRLDYILILNFGGLVALGQYVAITQMGDVLWKANQYFVGTLLPALTNVLASEGPQAASQVFSVHLRLIFAVYMAGTCALMFLVKPLVMLLGPRYIFLDHLVIIILLFSGLSVPGSLGATLLTSVGKQQRAVWVTLAQTGLFVFMFFMLWPHWRLLGATLAFAVSQFAANAAYLVAARYNTGIKFSALKDYAWFAGLAGLAAVLAAHWESRWLLAAIPACGAAWLLFLVLAGYRYAECKELLHCLVPLPPRVEGSEGV